MRSHDCHEVLPLAAVDCHVILPLAAVESHDRHVVLPLAAVDCHADLEYDRLIPLESPFDQSFLS